MRALLPAALFLPPLLGGCGGPAPPDDAQGRVAEERSPTTDGGGEGTVVTLTEAGLRTAGIQTAPVEERRAPVGEVDGDIPAQVEFDPTRVALISPRTSGRIERLLVTEGQEVRQGDPVAHLLSTAFLTAQHDFLQARRRARMLEGSPDANEAARLVEAAVRRLRLLGAGADLIDSIAEVERQRDLLPVTAPFTGRIVTVHALRGAAVELGTPIFTIADLTTVTVVAQVPETALPDVRVGQEVLVRLVAYPERRWAGRVARIKDEMNRATRTASAVIEVRNADGAMRPGMFASVRLAASAGAGGSVILVIPASAVVTNGAERYVFVERGERSFARRMVVPTSVPGEEGWVTVPFGLAAGERVVVRGAFTLKAELAKAAFGEHEH